MSPLARACLLALAGSSALLAGAAQARAAEPEAAERAEPLTEAAPVTSDTAAQSPDASDSEELSHWPGLSLGWDVHGEVLSMFKHYTIADRGAWYSGQGAGGGASLSLHFRPAAAFSHGSLRWMEFELGVSNSTHVVRWEEGEQARQSTDFIDNQTSLVFGFHVATGRWSGNGSPWSGAVLGFAWVPTYVHFFGSDDFASGGKLNHAGLRLSVDWGRVSPSAKGLVPGLRAYLTWLPYIDSLPTSVSAGVGCVFY